MDGSVGDTSRQGRNYRAIGIYGLLLIVSVGCIIGSYFLCESLLRHVVNEIGIAGLVGFLLAVTIEQLSAAEFRKLAEEERAAIKTDVFHYVYGRKIPKQITDEIDKQILGSDFLRRELYLEFDLVITGISENHEEYVKSTCKIKYQVENITGERKIFPLLHSIDRSPIASLAAQVKYTSLIVDGCERPFKLNEEELNRYRTEKENEIDVPLTVPQEITVLPDKLTTVEIQYQAIRNLKGGRIVFAFTGHVCDLDLTVHVPDHQRNRIEVFAGTYSPHKLKATVRHNPLFGYYNWKIDKPLLSYQAIYVTWTPPPAQRQASLPKRKKSRRRVAGG